MRTRSFLSVSRCVFDLTHIKKNIALHQKMTRLALPNETGWWFQTFFMFHFIKKGCHPSHWRTHSIIFQRGRSTTNRENRETLFKSAPKKVLYDLMTTELDEFLLGKVAALEAWRPHFSAAFCWATSLSQSGPGNQWKPMETHQSF